VTCCSFIGKHSQTTATITTFGVTFQDNKPTTTTSVITYTTVRINVGINNTSTAPLITATTTPSSSAQMKREGIRYQKIRTFKTCSKNFDCDIGEKCVTVYVGNLKNEVIFSRSQCFREEVSCKNDEDCKLGLKCFPFCYNKRYEKWYNEGVVSCVWNSNKDSYKKVECECINNLCEIKTPEKCKKDEDCNIGLRCYPGGYCQ
jgi:hypothetical protein